MGDPAKLFDTLSYAKKLQKAGFTQEQAEVQAETFLSIVQEQLVSKRDLKELETAMRTDIAVLKSDIAKLEIDLKRDMKEMETSLKTDIAKLERDMKEMETGLKRDMKEMETTLKADIIKIERDMKGMETSLKRDIKELELSTNKNSELLRRDMKIWFGSLLTAAVAVLAAIITITAHIHS